MSNYSKILALALGQKSFLLVELSAKGAGTRPTILRAAEFPLPENASLSNLGQLGQELAQFIRANKFSTRDVVMGLPARRLLTRRKDVPPAAPSLAASTLRLQAETDFPATPDNETFVVDFAGQTSASEPSSVLLIAAPRSTIAQCQELAQAAGLKLRGITATAAALARATTTEANAPLDGLILSLTSGAAELVVQHDQSPAQLRHLAVTNPAAPESLNALAGEIRRAVASLGPAQRNGSPLSLALWTAGHDADPAARNLLAERIGFPVTTPDVQSLVSSLQNAAQTAACAPAVAVALAAIDPAGLPVDFLHSRLAPPRETRVRNPVAIAAAILGLILLLIAAGYVDITLKERRLDELDVKSLARKDEVATAQTASDRLKEVNRWIHRTPRYIPCLRDLTALVPDRGNTIWATSLSLSADNRGVLTGKAVDQGEVSALKDKMLDSKQFLNPIVTYQESSRSTTGGTEKAFSITFTYRPTEGAK